jgi:hypothetical protein
MFSSADGGAGAAEDFGLGSDLIRLQAAHGPGPALVPHLIRRSD